MSSERTVCFSFPGWYCRIWTFHFYNRVFWCHTLEKSLICRWSFKLFTLNVMKLLLDNRLNFFLLLSLTFTIPSLPFFLFLSFYLSLFFCLSFPFILFIFLFVAFFQLLFFYYIICSVFLPFSFPLFAFLILSLCSSAFYFIVLSQSFSSLILFRWGTHLYVTFSVRPSAHLSIAHHISGTVHHLIIIFGTHV